MAEIGYSYKRFSTPEQRRGDSMRRQSEGPEAWCQRNGVVLDTAVTLNDLGVSAFAGLHHASDNADKYALAAFLEMCRAGRIARGSYLIVENLDRLTREHVRAAVTLFLSILGHGVNIVTLAPEHVYRHDSNELADVILAVVELSRGHAESARKSDIIGKAWRQRKARATEAGGIVTAQCPRWLTVPKLKTKDEKRSFVVVPERVAVVKRIFRECCEGKGDLAIAKSLNKDKVAAFSEGKAWCEKSVKRLLRNRAVLGEYQPHVGNRKRTPVGEPVAGYYPVIISETEFYAAADAIARRSKYGGKSSGKSANLFTSLVVDGEDGTKWALHGCGLSRCNGRQQKAIANVEATTKGIATRKAIPYRLFERAMLHTMRGLSAADLLPAAQSSEGDRLASLAKEISACDGQIAEAQEAMLAAGGIKAGMEVLRRLEEKKGKLIADYEGCKRSLATPVVDGLTQAHSLIDLLERTEDEQREALRDKLRARIASVIGKVTVWFTNDKTSNHYATRRLLVRVAYRNTSVERMFEIEYRPEHATSKRPEHFSVEPVVDLSRTNLGRRREERIPLGPLPD